MSNNNTIIDQSKGFPDRELKNMSTRERFEKVLEQYTGIQYVVVHDPLLTQTFVDGQQNPIWIIRKQRRLETGPQGRIEILDYYYILDQAVYQAPRLDSILSYRMSNTTLAMDKVVNTASPLPKFSATYGHTYIEPKHKPVPVQSGVDMPQSKVGTPIPETTNQVNVNVREQGLNTQTDLEQSDERTLRAALQMTLRHGKHYGDDAPLIGEPGNFRYSTAKEAAPLARQKDSFARSVVPSKTGTPVPAQSVLAKLTSTPPTPKPDMVTEPPKPKRKKSRAANDPV